MLAIIGVLLLINRQTAGLLETSFVFLLPLPMVFYSAKYGGKASWPVVFSAVLLCIILGTPQTVFYISAEALIGLYYGSGIHAHTESSKLVLTTLLMSSLVALLTMVVFASFFGYDLTAEISLYKDMFAQMNQQSGMNLDSMVNVDQFLKEIMIVSTIFTGILDGLVTHLLSRILLKRFHFHVEPAKKLTEYYPHKITGYIALAGMVGYMYSIQRPLENDLLQMGLQGLGMGCLFLLVFFGIVGIYTCIRVKFPRVGKWVILPIILITLSLNMLVAILGFLYITTDIHRNLLEGGHNA